MPEIAFRGAVHGAVVIGEVEMEDAVVERSEHDLLHLPIRRQITEIMPQAERDARQLQTARADMRVLHAVVAVRGGRIVRDEIWHRNLFVFCACV